MAVTSFVFELKFIPAYLPKYQLAASYCAYTIPSNKNKMAIK
ncbi:hypothetical protein [Formosa sp. 4Alg 33]